VTLVHGEYDQKTGEYDQNDDDDGSPHEFLIKPLDDDEGRFLDRHWLNDTCKSNENITLLESVDHEVFFISEKGEAVFDKEKYEYDDCLAWKHCKLDEMFSPKENPTTGKEAYNLARNINQCDFLVLLKNKLTVSQSFVFVFVTIILLCHMNADIEEASIEEALFRKNGSKNTPPTFPALILLASLRFRRFVLPWAMAMAVVSLTLTNDLSMKNVLLNVVALEFILQADSSLLVKYCCRNTNDSSTNARVNEGQHSYEEKKSDPVVADKDYSWLASRVETVVVGATMIVTVLYVMTVVEGFMVLIDLDNFSCDRLGATLWLGHIFGSLCTCIVHALCYFFNKAYEDCDEVRQRESKIKLLLEVVLGTLFQSMASLCPFNLYILINWLIDMTYYGHEELWDFSGKWIIDNVICLVVFLILYIALAKLTQKSI